MSFKKRGLGRGLDALISSSAASQPAEAAGEELRELALDALAPGKHQPRRHFDEAALAALAESIRAQGVVQPVVVREISEGRYEIVAGERRWRASRLAGLTAIPAIVRRIDDRTAMAVALVENIQRADLNPLEEAEALQRLIDECGLTHEATAAAVGRSRAAVSNLLRLIELHPEVQALVRDGRLTLGHAKVLLGVPREQQPELAQKVVVQQLSVRETEALLAARPKAQASKTRALPHALDRELSERIGLNVKIAAKPNGRGRVTIDFADDTQLQKLLSILR